MLGHGLTYYQVALATALGGAATAAGIWRNKSRVYIAPLIIVLACWSVGDIHHSVALARQVHLDSEAARGRDWPEQIAAFYGPDAAWAYRTLNEVMAEGQTLCVLGTDATTLRQRLAYWLAPARRMVDDCAAAEFILVYRPPPGIFNEAAGILRADPAEPMPVTLIAAAHDNLYLLRRADR